MTKVAIDVPGATALSMPPNRDLGLPEQRYVPENGYIDVERPDHIEKLASSPQAVVEPRRHGFERGAALACQSCGFRQFAAMRGRPCVRCGGTYGEVPC